MVFLASELKRIALDLLNTEEEGGNEMAFSTSLKAVQKRGLLDAAKFAATNLGDTTSITEKAIEYMQDGHGDEYYDYDSIIAFFQIVGAARSFTELRFVGLKDAANELEKAVNSIVEFRVDGTEDMLLGEAEQYICAAFGKICQKYLKSAINEVRDACWDSYKEVVENLSVSFFDTQFDCAEMIGKYFDLGKNAILQMAREQVKSLWQRFFSETAMIEGGILRFLYDCGDGAVAYKQSLKICQVQFKNRFTAAWYQLSNTGKPQGDEADA